MDTVPIDAVMVKKYYELCDERDALYKKVQPMEDALTKINSQISILQKQAEDLAKQIDEGLGGMNFINLKKQISRIAQFLRYIPPRK